MGIDIVVYLKRDEFEKFLKELKDCWDCKEVLGEMLWFANEIQGRRWYSIEQFIEDEGNVVNDKNFSRFMIYWCDESISEVEDGIKEEIEERESKDLLYYFYKEIAKKYRKLIAGLATPFYELKLNYYLFNDYEEVDENKFIEIEEAINRVIEVYVENCLKKKEN